MNRRLGIGLGAAVAVLAAGGGVAVLAWPESTPPPQAAADQPLTPIPADPAAAEPAVRATLDTVDLAPAAGGTTVDLPQRVTKSFSLLGVSWTDPAAAPKGAVEVRTRSVKTGKWTGWRALEPGEGGADPSTEKGTTLRGATEPMWVGASNGVAARIAGSGQALPAGLRLDLIDPGKAGGQGAGEPDPSASPSLSDSPSPSPSASPSETPPATTPATSAPTTKPATTAPTTTAATPAPTSTTPIITPLPAYVSRAGWSADEKLVTGTISAASQVRVLFVHHTAETNNYSCADSPAIVRAIQKYHVKTNGWSDIGYNFLVDKCGKLFEGRRGGVTKAIIGAHTYGFNTYSAGIAVLGHYSEAASPAAAEATIAQVAAARLGAYGFNPTTKAVLTEAATDGKFPYGQQVTFQRIAGHRDGVATECPGENLYARLPAIRALAGNAVSGLAVKPLTGAVASGGVYYTRSAVTASWSVTTPTANLSGFEVLLDGKVYATAAASARSAAVKIAPGSHTLAVRATHVSGAKAVSSTLRVIGDVLAPTFSGAPAVVLRGGTYSTSAVPVTVTFRAADNVKVGSLAATTPARAALAPAGTVWYPAVRPNALLTYSLTAKDLAGNARAAGVARKVTLLAETKAKKTGAWTGKSGTAYLNGKALSATKKNAKLTYTFTGRSAALLFARGVKTGKAYVYLDGKKVATVDTKAGKNAYRQALWVKAVAAKKHTVQIVVAGTSGRPTVVSDGLAYIG
ncbi:MAG: N-acetylmuramoyl-L-alanine amidase [Actinoplanes sp.]